MNFAMPKTREELARALRENNGALLCAGGTDLMIRLREKKQFHYSLIDLTHTDQKQGDNRGKCGKRFTEFRFNSGYPGL